VSEGTATAPTELIRALAHLAEPPGPAHAPLAAALGLPDPAGPVSYTDLFTFQLYPHAAVHLSPEGGMGGEAEERVRGFWIAVGREPPPEPDHLASLLGLYAALADEESEEQAPAGPRAVMVRGSRRALLDEHLVAWVFPYLVRVRELGGAFHRAWADLLLEVLTEEVRQVGAGMSVSHHLASVPGLSDPRAEGASAFLRALVAPARSGFLLTRADLAQIASALGLGLRAGERRYALEHLLAQDAAGVLGALAAEAGRQVTSFQGVVAGFGPGAHVLVDRAHASERLLRALAAATPSDGVS